MCGQFLGRVEQLLDGFEREQVGEHCCCRWRERWPSRLGAVPLQGGARCSRPRGPARSRAQLRLRITWAAGHDLAPGPQAPSTAQRSFSAGLARAWFARAPRRRRRALTGRWAMPGLSPRRSTATSGGRLEAGRVGTGLRPPRRGCAPLGHQPAHRERDAGRRSPRECLGPGGRAGRRVARGSPPRARRQAPSSARRVIAADAAPAASATAFHATLCLVTTMPP